MTTTLARSTPSKRRWIVPEWNIRQGDCLELLRAMSDRSVQCCVTSPPYWGLRDYGHDGQLGLEPTPDEFVANLVAVFAEVRRVLRDDGTLWLNLGDSYAGSWGAQGRTSTLEGGLSKGQIQAHPKRASRTGSIPVGAGYKAKDLIGVPWLTAFALRADGWYLRSEIIWSKPNPMPESVRDRPTKAHEQVFLLSKSARYFYDIDAVREKHTSTGTVIPWQEREHDQSMLTNKQANGSKGRPKGVAGFGEGGRNKRTVWTVTTQPFRGAHFATFPPKLIEPMILAGSKPGDTILDPFSGSGTTGMVALRHDRSYIGLELNPEYVELSRNRIRDDAPLLNTGIEVAA